MSQFLFKMWPLKRKLLILMSLCVLSGSEVSGFFKINSQRNPPPELSTYGAPGLVRGTLSTIIIDL